MNRKGEQRRQANQRRENGGGGGGALLMTVAIFALGFLSIKRWHGRAGRKENKKLRGFTRSDQVKGSGAMEQFFMR